MNNFRFTKIIAGVSPILAKETVLSKIINMVDAFRITLSKGYDDNNKKYIDTIMKLDNSKTIILETKGIDIRMKNTCNFPIKKGEKWTMEYSEYAQEGTSKIYIDYPALGNLKENTIITCEQSNTSFKILSTEEDTAQVEVLSAGNWEILQYDRINFDALDNKDEALTEKDKKDILRGLEYGAHVIGLACSNSAEHVESAKEFLDQNNAKEMKVFAKIETTSWLQNFKEILKTADGIILVANVLERLNPAKKLNTLIQSVKAEGKPVLITYTNRDYEKPFLKSFGKEMQELAQEHIDGIMLETFLIEDQVFDVIEKAGDILWNHELKYEYQEIERFKTSNEFEVRDYIIYNAFRSIEEFWIKTTICFTENGYTASRYSSLGPKIPIITFTQSKDTYRYLSLVRGVKGYKISQSFNYENLKKIGKEMIRMIFKGNISLDDKILILQANETLNPVKTDMINGIEFYNFKNI